MIFHILHTAENFNAFFSADSTTEMKYVTENDKRSPLCHCRGRRNFAFLSYQEDRHQCKLSKLETKYTEEFFKLNQ